MRGVVCQIRIEAVCISHFLRASNLCEHQTRAVFGLKLMVGGGEHKVVLDESGCRANSGDVAWGLNFLSVLSVCIRPAGGRAGSRCAQTLSAGRCPIMSA